MLLKNEGHIVQLPALVQQVKNNLLALEDGVVHVGVFRGDVEDVMEVVPSGHIGQSVGEAVLDEPRDGGLGRDLLAGFRFEGS